ncbi:MAG: biopolymer transporter ExbD [Hellea sp.]|nr:biopolymer transporter ExbD [Hellea sp.]
MARRRSRVEGLDEDTELNMTPMLDVVFILLIFFIVTTVFVKPTGQEPNKPFALEAEPFDPVILIAVNNLDEVWIDGQPYQTNQIRDLIRSMKDETPEATAMIIADRDASAGTVWEVQDLMQDLNIMTRVSTNTN